MTASFFFGFNFNDLIKQYDGQIVLNSNDKKTQALYNNVLTVFDKNKNGKLDADELNSIWERVKQADTEPSDFCGEITEEELSKKMTSDGLLSKLGMSASEILKFMKVLGNTVTSHFEKAQSTTKQRILKEVAEEKYPKDKYEIEVCTRFVDIKDKNTNKVCISYEILNTGEYDKYSLINTNGLSRGVYHYDKNGTLKTYEAWDGAERKSWDAISDLLNKDITAKNALGLPTTGKDFEKHIKQVNSENIVDILSNYEANYGESLLDAINGEWGLDSKVKDRIIKHLQKSLAESTYLGEDNINTKIDKGFLQGEIGDCWVLSAISAMQRTQKGQEILDNMITDNKDGSYTVKFKGTDKEITVSSFELIGNKKGAFGDMDVRILEIATEKFLKSSIKNAKSLDDGGSPLLAISLFSGNWKNLWNNKNVGVVKPSAIEKIKNLLQNKNMVITASTKAGDENTIPEDIKSKYFISYNHAYAVHAIDDKNIYLKNPQNIAATIAIPLDVFDEYWGRVQYTEIT